jgi:redox-sensing transcriptional repressor
MAGYVSEAVIRRLPGYYRHLKELETEGIRQISSQGLGERMKLTASQIRQDINCFGGFGRQGYGYSVSELREHIGKILGIDHVHKMVILGAGNIGRAVALSDSFPSNGFQTLAIFDIDPKKIGSDIGAIPVWDVETLGVNFSSTMPSTSPCWPYRLRKRNRPRKICVKTASTQFGTLCRLI